jgi:hypothetical protein
MFVGRKNELKQLNDLYNEDKFQMVVVYGRRRVGKTKLLTEFCKDKKSIFYVAEEHNNNLALQKFSELTLKFFGFKGMMGQFESWEQAFTFIANQSLEEPIVLVLDEFPYLAANEKSLPSLLQNLIDHVMNKTKLYIIICGSSMSFIEKEVLSYKSPLYGRMTSQFHVKPFDFYEGRKFLSNYTLEEQIICYGILGGIPQYLIQFDDRLSIEENIKRKILLKSSYLNAEPYNLLKQELREPVFYNSIIESIATGATKINQIATKVGESTAKVSRYLDILQELSVVEKIKPYGDKTKSRKTIYKIVDPLFVFWYRFVFANSSLIEQELVDEVYNAYIEPNLPAFIGKQYEKICMDYLLKKNREGELPFVFHDYGTWWGNNLLKKCEEEIDLVAGNKKSIIVGECKWKNQVMDENVLDKLIERSGLLESHDTYYYLFSKSGFSKALMKRKNAVTFFIGIDDLKIQS